MDFEQVVRARRMTRRFRPDLPVPAGTLEELVALAQRAPSAGFTQGWDVVALVDAADRAAFWDAVADPDRPPDAWLRGVSAAPALLVMVADPTAYLDRYAEPDKGWADRSPDRWPIPYWDTDTAMAAMIILLGATDRGLASLFFGVPGPAHDPVRHALSIPADRRLVGVIALGTEEAAVRSPSLARGRRALDSVLHLGRFSGASR
ncbi:MAG: nitroreductase family protein [Actinobacteria bacterium]|nr:nitroreductase family protein [Actinomycetota bacterium]